MSYLYEQHKRPQAKNMTPEPATAPGPDMNALISGQAKPTAAMKGTSFDLDGAVKAKMEHAFGDLSAVKLYQSQAVADAGAEAIAQGNEIAFAPGKTDFSTRSGQERLGHELSHVMSQRSGQVTGQGFLANASLEARADREGAMAAAGQQVYAGPVTHAVSDASPSPMAAGAMQVATIKKQHQAEAAGYYEGGFTGGRRYHEEAGVVHEGEFVANHQAVENPAVLPFLNFLDQAQRNNTVGSLTPQDVSRAVRGGGAAVVAPVVNVQTDNSELQDTLAEARDVLDRLTVQLEQGIGVDIPIDGENGLYRRIKRYENLINTK